MTVFDGNAWSDEKRLEHPIEASERLLERFLIDPDQLLAVLRLSGNHRTLERQEAIELLGCALWDVFSDNHSVIDSERRRFHLGTFRAAAGTIAESINARYPGAGAIYGYLDFYMGSMGGGARPETRAIYEWIFTKLRDERCDWIYSFPRLYLIDLGRAEPSDDALNYDPVEAVRADLERSERAESRDRLAEQLARAHEEDVRRARDAPLPPVGAAYRAVFGTLPEGWPHPDM